MRLLKATVLAAAVVALSAPAFAGADKAGLGGCGGYNQSAQTAQTAQTVVTPTGPQTVVQSVVQTADEKK